MTNREYWLMTEVFVYLHGTDECGEKECPHCKFINTAFPFDPLEPEGIEYELACLTDRVGCLVSLWSEKLKKMKLLP